MNLSPDDLFVQRRLSGVVRQLTGIVRNLEDFQREHPGIVAPNLFEAIIGNLKDDINILLREINLIGSPNRRELQERRHICIHCHMEFMTPLVAGICDECRSLGITSADLLARQIPAAETEQKPDDTDTLPENLTPSEDDPFADAAR